MNHFNKNYEIFYGDTDYKPSDTGLGNELFFCLKNHSHRIAQYNHDINNQDTFKDLLTKSIRTALKLQSLEIKSPDVITISSHNHSNTCIPFLAAQFIRCQVASLDPSLSTADSTYLLQQVEPKIIFTSEEGLNLIEQSIKTLTLKPLIVVFGETKKYIPFTSFLEPHEDEDIFKPNTSGSNKDTAIIFFSSGTTGLPKGICLSHYSLLSHAISGLKVWQSKNDCKLTNYKLPGNKELNDSPILAFTSFYWISAVMIMIRSVFSGEPRVIAKYFRETEWFDLVEKYRAGFAFLPPSAATDVLNNKPKRHVDTSSLRLFMTGSSTVTEQLMVDLQKNLPTTKIFQAYGQTEAGGIVTSFDPENSAHMVLQKNKPLSCGKGILGTRYRIVDPESGKTLGPNHKGEIRLKSPSSMNGYHKLDSSVAYDEEGWLKTGDIGYVDEDGCFFVLDRLKDMFKYKSWHIVPAVLENIIDKHPAVKEAAVVGVPHGTDGDHPLGVVVLKRDAKITPKELEEFVEEKVLERQRLRAGVKFVERLPKTVTGKINRREIRQMILQEVL